MKPASLAVSVDDFAERLQAYRPRRLPGRSWVARCGVVLLIAEYRADGATVEPSVLLMRRAERRGDPWSGHVSFPGGRVDPSDTSTRAAALRELQEEAALPPAQPLAPVGRLSDLLTREHGRHRPMVVSPYVYRTDRALPLQPSLEAVHLWWEPVSNLIDRDLRSSTIWRVAGLPLPVPSMQVSGAKMWGLSLMMTNEFLRAAGLKMRP